MSHNHSLIINIGSDIDKDCVNCLTVLQTFCEGPNNGEPSLAKFHEGSDPRTLAGMGDRRLCVGYSPCTVHGDVTVYLQQHCNDRLTVAPCATLNLLIPFVDARMYRAADNKVPNKLLN